MESIGIGALAKRARVDLLALSERRDVARVKRAAQAKLADVEQRISSLERMRDGLVTLMGACPGHGRPEDCPLLRALSSEESK